MSDEKKEFIVDVFKHPLNYLIMLIVFIGCKIYTLITGKKTGGGI